MPNCGFLKFGWAVCVALAICIWATSPMSDSVNSSQHGCVPWISAKVIRHGRYVAFQMAGVAIPRQLFADILRLIAGLRPPPDPMPT